MKLSFLLVLVLTVSAKSHSSYSSNQHQNNESICNGGSFFKSHISCTDSTITLHPMTCVSLDNNNLVASLCPYSPQDKITLTGINLTDFEFCSGVNRTGFLCSRCNDSHGLSLNSYSFKCLPEDTCHQYKWILFLLAETVPVTIVFVLFLIFDVKLTSGYANLYILYSNTVSLQFNELAISHGWNTFFKSPEAVSILASLFRVWSFQLGHEASKRLCVPSKLNQLTVISLQYVSVLYALFLVIVVYILFELHSHRVKPVLWLWKPFSLCLPRPVNTKTLLLNTLAGFYLMSFAKFLSVSLALITPARVYQNGTNVSVNSTVCFFDASKGFFKPAHAPYAALGLIVLILIVILPLFLLIVYQFVCCQSCLRKSKFLRPGLVTFMDAMQGCYRDGSEGGRDYRWFSSYYFILRILVFSLYLTFDQEKQFFELQLCLHCTLLVYVAILLCIRPYKYHWYNRLDVFLLSYSSFICAVTAYNARKAEHTKRLEIILYLLIAFPLVGAIIYVTEKLLGMKVRFIFRFLNQLQSNRRKRLSQSLSLMNEPTSSHSPLLKTLSDVSFPDRVLQPEVYRANSEGDIPTPVYGAVSHRYN